MKPPQSSEAAPSQQPRQQPQLRDYSYMQPSFVEFYDEMVDTLYGGINSPDMHMFQALLDRRLASMLSGSGHDKEQGSSKELIIMDLGCGTGRLTLALLHHLAATQLRQQQGEGQQLRFRFYGVDDSGVMLERASAKVGAFLDAQPSLKPHIHVTWVQSPFQTLSIAALDSSAASSTPDGSVVDASRGSRGAGLMLMAAGGLHHVTTTAELLASLVHMRRHLAPAGLLVLGYLSWKELLREEPLGGDALNAEAFRVGRYQRQRLSYQVQTSEDGSQTVYERFRLTTLGPDGAVLASVEEGWCLRRLEKQELLQLAGEAGLQEAAGVLPAKEGEGEETFVCLRPKAGAN